MNAANPRASPSDLGLDAGEGAPSIGDVEDPLFRGFVRGEALAIHRARWLVGGAVRFHAYSIPRDERADLEQDVMLHLWRAVSAPGFSFVNHFDGLVRSIAYRRCVDWRRRRRATEPVDDTVGRDDPPDRELLANERLELGRRVLEAMRAPCRELFRLHAAEGLSYREISQMQGRTETALRTQMSACLREARTVLARIRGA